MESLVSYLDLLNDELTNISSTTDDRYVPLDRGLMWEQEGLALMYEDDGPSPEATSKERLAFQRKARLHNLARVEAEIAKTKGEMLDLERILASYKLLDLESPIRKKFARGQLKTIVERIVREKVPLDPEKTPPSKKIRRIANEVRAEGWQVSEDTVRGTLRRMGYYTEKPRGD